MFGFFRKKEKREAEGRQRPDCKTEGRAHQDEVRVHRRLDLLLFGKKEISEDCLEDLEEVLSHRSRGRHNQELIRLVQEGVARKELDKPKKLRVP